jgi:hypothetical protein
MNAWLFFFGLLTGLIGAVAIFFVDRAKDELYIYVNKHNPKLYESFLKHHTTWGFNFTLVKGWSMHMYPYTSHPQDDEIIINLKRKIRILHAIGILAAIIFLICFNLP